MPDRNSNNLAAPVAKTEMAPYAEVFRALSDPIRTEIVRMAALVDELPCTRLEVALPVSKSTISYHVKILFHAGVLEVRKEGRFYFYRLREEMLATYLAGFLDRLKATPGGEAEPVALPAPAPSNRRKAAAA
jgi:ArsR family transcriptional regulator, arsenate/arsenite/antimonite-responsive transcriptional repressor